MQYSSYFCHEKSKKSYSPDVKHPALGLGLGGPGCQQLPAAAVDGEGVGLGPAQWTQWSLAWGGTFPENSASVLHVYITPVGVSYWQLVPV